MIDTAARTAAPTVVRTRTLHGAAGAMTVTATLSDGEVVVFAGSAFGVPGPVVMITEAWGQVRVVDADRFGTEFGAEWVRAFYA